MELNEKPKTPQKSKFIIVFCWAISIVILYLLHFHMGWYHGQSIKPCLCFGLLTLAIACGCPAFIVWLWISELPRGRKISYALIAVAVTIPAVWVIGFVWMLMHLAP